MAQKKMKDIFTHEMGQILFPGQPTVIETRKISPGTDITMKNTRPQIALTPYGAAQMSPDQNYSFAGNTVVELPMAQMGAQAGGDGQQAQIMQIIQMYAQLKGVDPNQLVQELQALPQEEQQKSFELMIGEVQTAMAQQQQAAQQPQDQQAMGMPMARRGGLMNPSPQAQDLEWFYKKARNGGLLKAQDQGNINLYDRVLADRNNFMSGPKEAWMSDPALVNPDGSLNMCLDCTNVDYQNKQDVLDAARLINEGVSRVPEYSLKDLEAALKEYNIPMPVYGSARGNSTMKGDPQQKKNGGLTMHQIKGVVDSMVKDAVQRYMSGGEAFPQANKYPEQWAGYSGTQYQGLDKSQVQENFITDYDFLNFLNNLSSVNAQDAYPKNWQDLSLSNALGTAPRGTVPNLNDLLMYLRSTSGEGPLRKQVGPRESLKEGGEPLGQYQGEQSQTGLYYKDKTGTLRFKHNNQPVATGKTEYSVSPAHHLFDFFKDVDYSTFKGAINLLTVPPVIKHLPIFQEAPSKQIIHTKEGGEPCIDCFDKYNPSPQAQTYLPYDRKGETRPNFMFKDGGSKDELGGQPDLDSIYRMMRSGGLAVNAKKKRGESLSPEEFQEYLSGGSLKEFQGTTQSTTGITAGNTMTGISPTKFQSPEAFGQRLNTIMNQGKQDMFKYSGLTEDEKRIAQTQERINESQPTGLASLPTRGDLREAMSPADNTTTPSSTTTTQQQKPGTGVYKSFPGIHPATYLTAMNTAMGGKGSALGLLGNLASLVADFATPPMAGVRQQVPNPYQGLFEQFQNKVPYSVEPAPGTIGPPTAKKGGRKKSLPKAQFQMPQLAGMDPALASQIAQGRGMTEVQGSGVAGLSNEPIQIAPMTPITQITLPQMDMQPVATSSTSAMNLGMQMPAEGPIADEMSIPKETEAYNPDGLMKIAPMRTISSVTPSTPAPEMQPKMSSQDLGPAGLTNRQIRQEDRNNRRELRQDWKDFKKTDEYKDARKQQRKNFWSDPNAGFDHAKAARMVAATQGIGDFFKVGNQEYMEDQLKKMGLNTSANLGVSQGRDRGDFMANTGRFRPDDYTEAQDAGRSMTDQTSFYNTFNKMYNAKMGGRILDFLEDGGVYELDEDTIRLIMEAGGSVEYI